MQASPTNKLYAEALNKLREFTRAYSSLKSRSVDEISGEVAKLFQSINKYSTGPSVKYEEIEYGSVPSSFEFNKFLEDLTYDVNVLIDESDIIKAAALNTHNFIKTEILKSQSENDRIHNKLKTLQLYSSSEDSSILYVGDYFYNDEHIDWDKIPVELLGKF